MKKTKLLSLMMMLVLVSIMAIGCKSTSSKDDETTAAQNSIVGTWQMDVDESLAESDEEDLGMSLEMSITYTFNEDGSGKINALGMTIDFKYSIDGDKLTMTVSEDGEEETESGRFSVEGDTLKLYAEEDGEESVTIFKRVK